MDRLQALVSVSASCIKEKQVSREDLLRGH
jgi:hypothetical protein